MSRYIDDDPTGDGLDRRGFLKCMAWTGTGLLWTLSGGVPRSLTLSEAAAMPVTGKSSLVFAQISDSHIGFSKEANPDVTATLQLAVDRLNALPSAERPAFVLHTGDISHLSTAEQFDTADQVLRGVKTDGLFFVPGEHDVLSDNGAQYLRRYGKRAAPAGRGWYSFDHSGVHFIGLVNVLDLKAGGLGALGVDQIEWLKRDVQELSASTPIVLFAHIPLWTVYPAWGWGTDDSAQALALLARFGSVTVLNGHIHQVMQKVEGHVAFHTAASTAFPQPAPGAAPSPGPMVVPADRLRSVLGVANVRYVEGQHTLAVVDSALDGSPLGGMAGSVGGADRRIERRKARPPVGPNTVSIDNFAFEPRTLRVATGMTVTWKNNDDVPHIIASTNNAFQPSSALDTGQQFTHTFTKAGTYEYFCSIHPTMTGSVIVS